MINKDEVIVSKMEEKDAIAVYQIERDLIGTSTISSILQTLNSDTLNYYTLKYNDEVIGFMEISLIPPDCELYDIAIKKSFQGQHLSDILMKYLFKICNDNKCETIFLEVNNINSKAIRLYKKYGFEKYFIRKNYYGKSDAILMKVDVKLD